MDTNPALQGSGASHAEKSPPVVTRAEWLLSLLALAASTGGYLNPAYEHLRFTAWVLLLVSLGVLAVSTLEALRHRLPGKWILVACVTVFFWLEAQSLADRDPPFATPGIPMFGVQFSSDLIQLGYLYVAAFQLMLLLGYSIRPRMEGLVRIVQSRVDTHPRRRVVVLLGLLFLAFLPLLVSFRFDLVAASSWMLAARTGDVTRAPDDIGLMHFLSLFGMYGASYVFALSLVSTGRRRIFAFALALLSALPFISGGTRHIWLFVALPAAVLVLRRLKDRISLPSALKWSTLLAAIVLVIQLQFAVRDKGWERTFEVRAGELIPSGSTGQFEALLVAEALVPANHEYFMEPATFYFLIHWFPRRFWPEKPVMRSWEYYNGIYTDSSGAFNVTPSIIGQYHINWGPAGVLGIGLWLGLLAMVADRLLLAIEVDRQRGIAVAIGMFYAFIACSFRFYHPLYFAYLLFGIAASMTLTVRRPPPPVAQLARA